LLAAVVGLTTAAALAVVVIELPLAHLAVAAVPKQL
jgi:hypothetical protein